MDELTPFRIDIPQADLDDLRDRLARTRWPDEMPGAGWDYGIPLGDVRELAGYWRAGYDWRVHEGRLNGFASSPPRSTGSGALPARALAEPDALPLIMTHGWPGSVVEFIEVIGPLTDPARTAGSAATRSTWSSRRSRGSGSPGRRASGAGTCAGSRGRGPS